MQTKQIQVYSLIDFLLAFQAAYEEGFRVSTESGFAPVEIAGYYVATLCKGEAGKPPVLAQEPEPVAEVQPDPAKQEDEDGDDESQPVKRSRKPKA
jgi:hypothetical protein